MNEVISWVVFAHRSCTCCAAAGTRLLAAGETWQLIEHHDWPVWLFWLLIVVMLALAMLNTAARMSGDQHTRRPAGAEPAPAAEAVPTAEQR